MDPVTAWIGAVALGVVLLSVCIMLVRRWGRENRRKYPDRHTPGKLFEINRQPR